MPIDPKFWNNIRRLNQVIQDRKNREELQKGVVETPKEIPESTTIDVGSIPQTTVEGILKVLNDGIRQNRMVVIVYQSRVGKFTKVTTRQVEPYEVNNVIRTQQPSLYLWAWYDYQGFSKKKSAPGIRSFKVSNIKSAVLTNITFTPRFVPSIIPGKLTPL